jgi:hypothetical protein
MRLAKVTTKHTNFESQLEIYTGKDWTVGI